MRIGIDIMGGDYAPLEALTDSIGVKVVVEKTREIYYIENVKFHLDELQELGAFVEIEAGNILVDLSQEQLKEQCDYYIKEFGIKEKDMISNSYSDMMLNKK